MSTFREVWKTFHNEMSFTRYTKMQGVNFKNKIRLDNICFLKRYFQFENPGSGNIWLLSL